MTPEPDRFAAFSRRLDVEHLRSRIRRTFGASPPEAIEDPAALSKALEVGDPLGADPARRGWIVPLRELIARWPGRAALAGALAAMLVIGIFVGRASRAWQVNRAGVIVAEAPPLPAYRPSPDPGLGIRATESPVARQKFREAMAQLQQPDFARRAIPLLREAVAADPENDEARFWLGVLLLRERSGEEAIRTLEAAVRLAPGNRTYKEYLLYAYIQAGERERAQALQRSLLDAR
ncbi:MAG TPA: tetratricopeptide repeat protein [Candidatus Eisenbacteria bacterium]|nr:tetratricopeptide repeat protein [Candidatus Eisenbacteria bacterium]